MKGLTSFYMGSQLLTHILAVFLNVGSISVVHHLASIHPSSTHWRVLSNALNRGFAFAMLWSPYFAAMALVTSALRLSWTELLPYVGGLCAIGFVASYFAERPGLRRLSRQPEGPSAASESAAARERGPEGGNEATPSIGPLLLYLMLAIMIVLTMEQLLDMPMVIVTAFAAAAYPLLWCMMSRSVGMYIMGVRDHVVKTIPSLKKEILLFLTAGFFSGAIGTTSFGAYVPRLLEAVPMPAAVSFTIGAMLLIYASSLIGVHPIIVVTVLATSVDPAAVGISAQHFGILLLGSWSLSNPISPASAVNNLIANLMRKEVVTLPALNYKFSVVLLIALPLYLFAIRV
ncbi:hypothetical protein MO973_22450 [Paenibacillus sp. TRM 82003]|nr:hypothetical protein [Paenibacillus sp. TRM 82003]